MTQCAMKGANTVPMSWRMASPKKTTAKSKYSATGRPKNGIANAGVRSMRRLSYLASIR